MAFYFSYDDEETEQEPIRPCDHVGCGLQGVYPAPKSRQNLREFYYFCLEHVREYNAEWNYFKDYSEDQLYRQMKQDVAWDRPTWPSSVPLKLEKRLHDFVRRFTKDNPKEGSTKASTPLSKEARALELLGLKPDADMKLIKKQYRELVKRYHPDKNPDNPKAAERFKLIAEAYMILSKSR